MKKILTELKKELSTVTLRLTILTEESIELDKRGRAMNKRYCELIDEIARIEESLRND